MIKPDNSLYLARFIKMRKADGADVEPIAVLLGILKEEDRETTKLPISFDKDFESKRVFDSPICHGSGAVEMFGLDEALRKRFTGNDYWLWPTKGKSCVGRSNDEEDS